MPSPKARAPKGTSDMLPDTARTWEQMLRTAQDLFARYGYEPIYTPLFEHTDVFVRGIGEATDIVGKEMYTFSDKGGRSITLRPEGTASVVRAALEHGLASNGQGAKLYYAGPMFRYERPQAGRMRQFWQIGIEALGMAEPTIDAEVIVALMDFFAAVGIPRARMRLLLNSMGDEVCRPAYRDKVAAHIRENAENLCEECVRRAETNPLRAFDCKNPACRDAMATAPLLRDELCDECAAHYAAVKDTLDELGVTYEEDSSLVRGLDYYTRTVFEVQAEGLGSQNAVGGGGRYDRLMETFGGPPTPGLGFAIGFERTLLALKACQAGVSSGRALDVFVSQSGDWASESPAFQIAQRLRGAGIAADMDHQGRSGKAQMKLADRAGARYAVIVHPSEWEREHVVLRDMSTSLQEEVPVDELVDLMLSRLEGD